MATNNFIVFDETNTNILSDAEYLADGQRKDGVYQGVARSKLVNKALRNTSTMTAAIGQLIADSGTNATENVSALKTALQNVFSGSGTGSSGFKQTQISFTSSSFTLNSSTNKLTATASISGIDPSEANQLIIVIPKKSTESAYRSCGIQATAQGTNSLTFTALSRPTSTVYAYVAYCSL